VNGIKKEYAERIDVLQVNVLQADNAPILKEYGFSTTPEVYLVDGSGKVLGFWDEIDNEADFKQQLDALLIKESIP
jgi:hypothetical protein